MKKLFYITLFISLLAIPAFVFADSYGPTTSILSPIINSTASKNTARVLVQAWDADGLNATTPIEMQMDSSGWFTAGIANSGRTCMPASAGCVIYQYNWDISTYGDNTSHTIEIRTRDTLNQTTTKSVTITVKGAKTGDGNLLAKERSDQLCIDCHNVSSHSSQAADTGDGNWAILCTDCHTAHNTKNIMIIKDNITTPNSGVKAVKLYNRTGDAPNSFVDSTATGADIKGVCQVCHTQTVNPFPLTARWRNTGNGGAHYTAAVGTQACTLCHTHAQGFKSSCDMCHDAPPAAGKHATHFGTGIKNYGNTAIQSTPTAYGFSCGICHNGTHLNTASNPRNVQVIFTGVATQDGASGADYAAGSFSVDDPGKGYTFNYSDGTCSNIYCHGKYPGSGKNASPAHETGAAPCGSCHEASNATTPASGKHKRHTSTGLTGGRYDREYACTLCHKDIVGGSGPASYTVADKSKHVNGYIDWKFDTSDSRVSASSAYSIASGTAVPSDGTTPRSYGSCSNVYCHSNVQPDGGVGAPTYDTISWSATVNCSNKCHAPSDLSYMHGTTMATGSHTKHMSYNFNSYQINKCTLCHKWNTSIAGTFDGSTCTTSCHSTPEKTLHVDGSVNVVFDTYFGAEATYSGTLAPGDGYGNCSNTYCHSYGTSVSTGIIFNNTSTPWGSGTLACNACHRYPPDYPNGSLKKNNHSAHSGKTCDNCHYSTTTNGTSITSPANHVNKTYDLQAGSGVSFSYTYSSEGGSCSSISCHSNTASAWGTTACLDCHSVSQGSRAAITTQFSANSHHIQGAAVTNTHCYQCHWEADSNGMITSYHGGSANPGSPVDLVIYGAGARPTVTPYVSGSTGIAYTANGLRTEVQKINSHCLGCHSEQNNTTQPFVGDVKTPKQYAWDGYSVAVRYSNTNTTAWGKYSGGNITPKNTQIKAYSAHGNAVNNQGGWDLNETWPNMRNGSVNVACFDCHNSHGSNAAGTTTSYTSATTNGGILKDTATGKGGYSMTYQPQAGGSAGNKNAYNPGAGLCFDCHLTANAGTKPWGYSGTFGATQSIMGYFDTLYFGPGTSGPEQRFIYKSKSEKGGHFGASSALSGSPTGTINGLCTPCHDPHGVSATLGANQQYAVPLLKGTWLVSPYKEDVAPANNAKGTVRDSTYPTGSDGTPREGVQYHIDQNTFGVNIRASVTGITQTDTQFAGLCLNCHTKNSLTDGVNGGAWKSVDRIHESVKGWGANTKHNYPCSKCHTPHNSSLPRLMAANCLNKDHKGRVKYSPFPVLSGGGNGDDLGCYGDSTTLGFCWWFPQWSFVYGNGGGRMPGSWGGSYPGDYSITCHENNAADQSWNVKTAWAEDIPVITSGPSAGSFTAVGSNVQATITWGTSTSYSTSYVDYGLTPAYGSTTGNGALVLNHSVTIQNLTNHSTYNYRVRSASGAGQETSSGNNTFYISAPPTVPSLTAEADTICDPSCSVTLQWNASSDPDSGPIEYQVEVDTSSSFNTGNKQTSSWISATSWSPTLATNNTWYWQVKARDANHTEAVSGWSASDNFIMSDGVAPPQVTLAGPANGSGFADYYCGGSPVIGFSWNAVPPPAEYYVEVSTDPTFTAVNYPSGWINITSWSVGVAPGATYYWRVQARDAVSLATGPWSSTWSFTVTDWGCKSSCPFIYVWDGEKYQYITDIQGSAIGYPPDSYLAKYVTMFRPVYIVLNGLTLDGLGKYSIKLRETLAEISYADEAKLLVVDYPEGYEIASSSAEGTYRYGYVNPFKLYTLKDPRPPISAEDKNGADILASVLEVDGNLAPEELNAFDFYTLDFGGVNPGNAKLVIEGWSVYGNEYKTTLTKTQPYIEVMNGAGEWVKVKSFGVPAGDMKRMVIDISNLFLSDDHRIRVHTGADSGLAWRIDRLMLDDSAPVALTVREVSADYADLHHKGMARHAGASFDHRIIADDSVLPDNPIAYGYGSFTRYGDVKVLLNVTDDMFAIMRHGDEISITFTGSLPPLPQGMVRGFVLKADVYYKTFRVDNKVELLPFHGMSIYPYDPAVEHYPDDAQHNQYRLEYNTREYSQ